MQTSTVKRVSVTSPSIKWWSLKPVTITPKRVFSFSQVTASTGCLPAVWAWVTPNYRRSRTSRNKVVRSRFSKKLGSTFKMSIFEKPTGRDTTTTVMEVTRKKARSLNNPSKFQNTQVATESVKVQLRGHFWSDKHEGRVTSSSASPRTLLLYSACDNRWRLRLKKNEKQGRLPITQRQSNSWFSRVTDRHKIEMSTFSMIHLVEHHTVYSPYEKSEANLQGRTY